MRKYLNILFSLLSTFCFAQTGLFVNGADASLRVDSNSYLSVDGDFRNLNCDAVKQVRFNGPLYLSGNLVNDDTLKFSATAGPGNAKKARIIFRTTLTYSAGTSCTISGNAIPKFWEVEVDKGNNNSVTLQTNVRCQDTLTFKTGNIFMNGFKWNIIDPVGAPSVMNHPYIKNERYGSEFMASSLQDTGLVIYKTIYNYSVDINPANIGIQIFGLLNIGSDLNIFRGFKPQVNAAKGSVLRYFDIYSPGQSLANNSIKVNYSYADFSYFTTGYYNLSAMRLFVSPNSDMNWSVLPSTVVNTIVSLSGPVNNGVMTATLTDMNHTNVAIDQKAFRITIADPNCTNPPISALIPDTMHLCTGSVAILDAGNNSQIPNSPLKWEWSTVPPSYTQTISTIPGATHKKFVVSLKDVRGCVTKDSIVIAPQAPYPQITYFNHLNSCFGDSVIIKDTVTISSGSFNNQWTFSDATSLNSNAQHFKRKFASPGEYSMQLVSTSNYGCSVTVTSTNITVYPLPIAAFVNSFNCSNGVFSFSSTSVSNHTAMAITSLLWNLGQGTANTSTLLNPSQSYSASGTYTVKLKISTNFGCKDSVESIVTLHPDNSPLFSKNNSCLGDTVYLTNSSACNTGSCNYQWDFGDGSFSSSLSPKKKYSAPGLYSVKLKINAPVGCPDSMSISVFVNPKPSAQFNSSVQDVCINTPVYFSNGSSISSGSISSYNWNFGNGNTATSINSTETYSNSGVYGVSLTAVSDSGCVSVIDLPVTVHSQPTAQYTVSNNCLGDQSQFISSSSGSGLSYVWYYGNSTVSNTLNSQFHNYMYPVAGVYTSSLIISDVWSCSDTSSITHTVFTSPVVSLGNQISTCGSSYTFDAGNPGSSFLWQPGNQTTQTIIAQNTGQYQVAITNTNGCIGSGTVQLTLNAPVVPYLGNDSTVCGSIVLDAGYPGSTYTWGSSQTTQTILATNSGVYSVTVTDQNACVGTAIIQLTVNSAATVDLGNDLLICKPKHGLVITPTTNASSYQWNTGSTASNILVTNNGSYWLEVTASNGCKKKDTVTVLFLTTPQPDLGPDKSLCGSAILDAQNSGATYLWSTNEVSQTISANLTGNYWVSVTNTVSGCSQNDTIFLTIFPLVNVFLGNDTSFCDNTGFLLNAGNPGATYSWANGQNTQFIPVTSSGLYGVSVTNNGGCSASDYIQITLLEAPTVELGSSTRYLCGNNFVELDAGQSGDILWSNETGTLSTEQTLQIQTPGEYKVRVSTGGCAAYDSVMVSTTNNTIQAQFLASTIDTVNRPVQFVNLSTPAPIGQLWQFGDGLTSSDLNPIHTFVLPVDYSVTLEVTNGFCSDRITKALSVLFRQGAVSIHQPITKLELLQFNVFPNPGSEIVNVFYELNDEAPVLITLTDISGRLIYAETFERNKIYSQQINIRNISCGVYMISAETNSAKGNVKQIRKFIKTD
ncbi:MAG: PKD domain-containing protein [Bacteroidia bacterium]|nr:PKD domain-containing protein [Bacteroidia bacterium]